MDLLIRSTRQFVMIDSQSSVERYCISGKLKYSIIMCTETISRYCRQSLTARQISSFNYFSELDPNHRNDINEIN